MKKSAIAITTLLCAIIACFAFYGCASKNVDGAYKAQTAYQLAELSSILDEADVVIQDNKLTIDDVALGTVQACEAEEIEWATLYVPFSEDTLPLEDIQSATDVWQTEITTDYRWAEEIFFVENGENLFMLFGNQNSIDRIFMLN